MRIVTVFSVIHVAFLASCRATTDCSSQKIPEPSPRNVSYLRAEIAGADGGIASMLQFPHEYIRASLQGTYAVVMFRTSPLGAVLSIEKLGIAFLGEGTGVGIVLDESWSSRVRELEPYLAPRRREDVPRLVFVPKGQWSQKTFSLAAPGKTPVAAFTEEVRAMVERGAVVAFPMVVGFAPFK